MVNLIVKQECAGASELFKVVPFVKTDYFSIWNTLWND